ncbi:hypothetical protein [Kitasatospora sp. NPDC005751]|uniref:hypothetical protein n=1 Tax=Kitasatospora sp. NPDC005751 TaxID=3157064 RepID=UPI0033C0A506
MRVGWAAPLDDRPWGRDGWIAVLHLADAAGPNRCSAASAGPSCTATEARPSTPGRLGRGGLDGGDGWVAGDEGYYLGDPATQQAVRILHHAHFAGP